MMNRIIVGLGVGLLFGLTQSTDAQQQKKALDINACMSWKRVDSPEISSTGRWVTYRVVSMEYNPEDRRRKSYTCLIRVHGRRSGGRMSKDWNFTIRIRLPIIRWQILQEI